MSPGMTIESGDDGQDRELNHFDCNAAGRLTGLADGVSAELVAQSRKQPCAERLLLA